MQTDLIIYSDLTSPYMRIVRVADCGIAIAAGTTISRTTSWATSYTTLTANALIKGIPVNIPQGLPPGDYDLLIYDSASPLASDAVQIGKRIAWDGNRLLGLPLSL